MSKRNSKPTRSDRLRRRAMQREAGNKFKHLSDNELAGLIPVWSEAFLSTPAWRTLRKEVIAKQGKRCACCGRTPRKPQEINVDHIKPRKYYPDLALEESNLQVLCGGCNKRKGNCEIDYRNAHLIVTHGEYSDDAINRKLREFC